jgi:hypothetical protein
MEQLLLLSFSITTMTLKVPATCSQTNIVLVVTDHQDLTLGGLLSFNKEKERTDYVNKSVTNK